MIKRKVNNKVETKNKLRWYMRATTVVKLMLGGN